MPLVDLFGGAIRCSMADEMVDVSNLREVPDHQEVYMHPDTGATLIVELLARQAQIADDDAAEFFFMDLAKDNGSLSVESIEHHGELKPSGDFYPNEVVLPSGEMPFMSWMEGVCKISKYTNEVGKESDVSVSVVVIRCPPPIASDMLISFSAPVVLHPESSDAERLTKLLTEEERQHIFSEAVKSFSVIDWDVFVVEE